MTGKRSLTAFARDPPLFFPPVYQSAVLASALAGCAAIP